MDASSGSLRLTPQALARDGGPLCFFSQSPLWCIFCAGLGPHGCRDIRHAAVLGFHSGECVSTGLHDTPGSTQAKGLHEGSHHSDSSVLATEGVVSGSSGTTPGISSSSAGEVGSPEATSCSQVPSVIFLTSSSYMETIKRFVRASGLSYRVARRLGPARRASSIANYQSKWFTYRRWCWEKGHSVSNPSVANVADYLLWLWETKGLSLSSVKAHRSMLSAVFRFKLPELGEHHVLRDLLRSFAVERPRIPQVPPSWDLDVVLRHLMSLDYEPLENLSLRALTKKTLLLVALATTKMVGELQALSRQVSFQGNALFVSYLPHFVAKTDRLDSPLPRSFRVCSLREFVGDLEEGSLLQFAPSMCIWTRQSRQCSELRFCVPSFALRQISKNAIFFFFLQEVILGAGTLL